MSGRARLLLYCQHSLGLGHLVRSYALAASLCERFDVHLACGGALPSEPAPPPGVTVVPLSPLGAGPDGALASQTPDLALAPAREARRAQLLTCLHAIEPSVILIELWPFGRKQFTDEIVALLTAARELSEPPLVVSSVRDLLVAGRERQQRHDDRARAQAEQWLDAVLVHSDPRVATLGETFRPSEPLAVPVTYTGFVTAEVAAAPERLATGTVVVSAGGGAVGEPLLRTVARAHELLGDEAPPVVLVAGPFFPAAAFAALAERCRPRARIELRRSVPALAPLLAGAAGSISQCGYNTALEVTASGVPAVVVPYVEQREDEQLRRARRLAQLGLLRVLHPADASPEALAAALRGIADFTPAPASLDRAGARRTVAAISGLLAQRRELAGALR